jgi:sialic acid synthase SpsE/sugar phosphate isomerase/epimerase
MIIFTDIDNFIVRSDDSIDSALKKLELNQRKIIFVVSHSFRVIGSISDGDVRRWLQNASNLDIRQRVSNITHYECYTLSEDTHKSAIARNFNQKISLIPLVDRNNKVVSIACDSTTSFTIGGKDISNNSETYVIAEIGNNHNGSFEMAIKLVDEAILAGANSAKFQMRSMDELYGNSVYEEFDLGSQYIYDLLSKYQLSDDNLYRVFDYCHKKNITPMCTPFDLKSLSKLEQYGIEAYKVASADFTNHDFLKEVSQTEKPMICSTGMSQEVEIVESIGKLKVWNAKFMLLHCNSTYPAPFKDINLKYMDHLRSLSDTIIGYSGHERGISVPIAAVSLGARIIEKHFTLDKTMEGNDHRVSLLPNEFKEMVKGIRQVEDALGSDFARTVSQGEMMNRENLAKSLVAASDIEPNTLISANLIEIKSPGSGIQPNKKSEILGNKIFVSKKKGEPFFKSDFAEQVQNKNIKYSFPFKWGIPVRYYDIKQLSSMANIDLVEVHLSNSDLGIDFRKYLHQKSEKGLVVHCPELFSGDSTLDLCTDNEQYRLKSVSNLQKVIDLTLELNKYFTNKKNPLIVTNVGGFSNEFIQSSAVIEDKYRILSKSLNELNFDGVEIIPQTMPPFPWHNGGQQCHNLFVDSKSIVKFCKETRLRICLDISHSKLACNYNNWDFVDFMRDVSPYVAHMHLSDSKGVDGEGLQFGEGDIDWKGFWINAVSLMPKNTTFIPEVWQGHKNQGKAMWKGLKILESFL